MPYDQNNPTADKTTTDHSYSNSNSSASSQNVRRPLNLRLSLQHLLTCFLNRPRKARATHHPLPTGQANGKPSHEPGLTEAPGSGRGPRNQPVTGSARATRTTRWQHGWRRASRRWPGTVLDISEARAGTGGRGSGATTRRRIRSHRLRKTGVKERDMRVSKLPACLVAETRVRREGDRKGRAYDDGGEQGGHGRAVGCGSACQIIDSYGL